MRKIGLLITIALFTLNAFSQEEQNLKVNPLIEIQHEHGDLKQLDFEKTLEIREEIIGAIKSCLGNADSEIEFSDLFKNEVNTVFHFRDVLNNQMYLFVGDHKFQNSRCTKLSFREAYENYKLMGKTE